MNFSAPCDLLRRRGHEVGCIRWKLFTYIFPSVMGASYYAISTVTRLVNHTVVCVCDKQQ